jgi:hypothetical protein
LTIGILCYGRSFLKNLEAKKVLYIERKYDTIVPEQNTWHREILLLKEIVAHYMVSNDRGCEQFL